MDAIMAAIPNPKKRPKAFKDCNVALLNNKNKPEANDRSVNKIIAIFIFSGLITPDCTALNGPMRPARSAPFTKSP